MTIDELRREIGQKRRKHLGIGVSAADIPPEQHFGAPKGRNDRQISPFPGNLLVLIGDNHEDRPDAAALKDAANVRGIFFRPAYHEQGDHEYSSWPGFDTLRNGIKFDRRLFRALDRKIGKGQRSRAEDDGLVLSLSHEFAQNASEEFYVFRTSRISAPQLR